MNHYIDSSPIREAPAADDDTADRASVVDRRRVLRLFRPHRWPLLGVALLIATGAALEIITPFTVQAIVDVALPRQDFGLLASLVAVLIAVAAASAVIGLVQILIASKVGQAIMHGLRVQVYSHLQRLALRFFTATRSGEVQSRISNDIGGMQSLVTHSAVELTRSLASVIASTVAMLVLDWRLALFSFALLPLTIWLNGRIGSIRERITVRQQERLADLTSTVQESLSVSGIVLGKTTASSARLIERFTRTSRDVARLEVRSHTAGQWEYTLVMLSVSAMPALTYLLGGWLMGHGSVLTIGTLVAMIALQEALIWPLEELLRIGVEYKAATALFSRVFEYLDKEVEIVEPAEPVTIAPGTARGSVRFDNVSFSYTADQHRPTLQDIDLVVPAGSHVGIVGATGSGKSTLGYLLARLYDVAAGSVTVDGIDVRDLSFASLASVVGVVTQEVYLFNGSVAENLRFGSEDASDAELVQAARAAQVHDLIVSQPKGYDTAVGERGYRFSGGEKQRLAIARAILRNPRVLLLDEATSALDTRTERAVTDAMATLLAGRTLITIAHRLSTVRRADQIIVMDRGRILERGSHDELIAHHGKYAELVVGPRS